MALRTFAHTFIAAGYLAAISLLAMSPASAQSEADCLDTEASLSYWRPIFDNRESDSGYADDFALDLVACLGSDNPTLRDTYGYGLFTHWLRNDALREDTKLELFAVLNDNLQSEAVLLRSFSALVLSELLRADAQQAFLTDRERNTLTLRANEALLAETDFRGFDAALGWVHPVAHLADVHWRLALHPQLNVEQARRSLVAIYGKAVTQEAAYTTNESDRLARAVAILIRTEILESDDIATWLSQFATRQNGEAWPTVFSSAEGMIELHNSKSFVRALAEQLAPVELPALVHEQLNDLLDLFRQLV